MEAGELNRLWCGTSLTPGFGMLLSGSEQIRLAGTADIRRGAESRIGLLLIGGRLAAGARIFGSGPFRSAWLCFVLPPGEDQSFFRESITLKQAIS